MRKIYLLILTSFVFLISSAQTNESDKNAAIALVSAHRTALGLSAGDLDNLAISSSYIDKTASGTRLVYLQQTYKGIPVYNQIQVLAFKDSKLLSNSGRIENNAKAPQDAGMSPSLAAESAIAAALADRGLVSSQPAILLNSKENNQRLEFSKMGISRENITVQLMWVPSEDGKALQLGWQVFVVPTGSSDYWLVRVDANDGKTLGVTNLTVYCNWDDPAKKLITACERGRYIFPNTATGSNSKNIFNPAQFNKPAGCITNSPAIVGSASYLVIKYPTEAPSFAAATVHTDPWLMAAGNATSFKWHYDGITNYTITRGNNVWAKEDRAATNSNAGVPATTSTSPDPLTFNFVPNYAVAPTDPTFQQFAITNLFYWNNLMHDISYLYGFDEAAANFQANNQGRGGSGNDFVYADAQDGSGSNNANFATSADGINGRMQMYLFTSPTPDRDGDIDNGVVCHEYGHGISHRLTGGPAGGAGCMSNSERGDEGWSDYYALMMTTDWSTALVTDGFNKARPMGTYVLNQATTGAGIRAHPYCTNMVIDPWTYSGVQSSGGEVHDIGEIWCSAIWDMTWNIIQVAGINPNLFNPAGAGGNSIALKLVIMGEKLQKCSPGFLDSRDAILQADQVLYNGTYHCAIVNAFARRGMGFDAKQGSSNNTSDQVQGFSTEESSLGLTESVTQQQETHNVTYTNSVTAFCSALANYTLRDTLPSNVTYVSGGSYDAPNRVVSFSVNLPIGTSQDYSFTVTINAGTYFTPAMLLDEQVSGAAIPAAWAATTATGTSNWVTSTAQSHSATRSLFATDNALAITDFRIATTASIPLGAPTAILSFWHNYNTEAGWDGGVVEISTNGGVNWTDLGSNMTTNGYNSSVGGTNPIAGRSAFSGNSGGWIQTTVNLLPYANQNAMFRFRMTSDDNTASTGWYVDDISVTAIAEVNMRTSLFNSVETRIWFKDTVTLITPVVLPVELISFTATARDNGKVNLEWSTLSEHNNKGFQVERSPDVSNGNYRWEKIGFVIGNLNSTVTRHYAFEDAPVGGKRFVYRLKQIDLDQNFKFSETRLIVLKGLDYSLYSCFPNPVSDLVNIKYQLPENTLVELAVFDNAGKLIKQLVNESKEAGVYQVSFATCNLPAGLYFYKLKAGSFSETKRFTIAR
ncbi:MAG: M36 family metallopeptidase [Ferruginibacter sp.]